MNAADRIIDWLAEHIFGWVLLALLLFMLVGLVCMVCTAIWPSKSTKYYSLDQSQWVCSQTHTETTLIPMLVGKTTMLMPETSNVCTQFSKK